MGETTVAAAAARASRVCWTCWEGDWGKGPDSVLPNCPGWCTLGGQEFQFLHCVGLAICQPLGLKMEFFREAFGITLAKVVLSPSLAATSLTIRLLHLPHSTQHYLKLCLSCPPYLSCLHHYNSLFLNFFDSTFASLHSFSKHSQNYPINL